MARNLISGPILTRLGQMWAKQNLFRGFYLYQYLDIFQSIILMQLKGKLMKKTWNNGEKTNFRPDFGLNLVQIS